jgi:transposase
MIKPTLPDDLWDEIAALLPRRRRSRKGGRPRCDERTVMEAILFVLRTGLAWERLPASFGCSGMTCWRRVEEFHRKGIWKRLHGIFLNRLHEAGNIDWNRISVDSSSVPAPRGARQPGATQPIEESLASNVILQSMRKDFRSVWS